MLEQLQVTIAADLKASEICNCTDFPHGLVIDLRHDSQARPMPVDESTLKRLQNYFVHYEQMPMDLSGHDEGDELKLHQMLQRGFGNILVLSENIAAVAAFCRKLAIPFQSNALYVVETGKGNEVRSASWQPGPTRMFGTFGG